MCQKDFLSDATTPNIDMISDVKNRHAKDAELYKTLEKFEHQLFIPLCRIID